MNDQILLETIADKYNKPKSGKIWKIDLFNNVCDKFDLEARTDKEIEFLNGKLADAYKELSRLDACEKLILSMFINEKSDSFKRKLREHMHSENMRINETNGKPYIHVKTEQSRQSDDF
jgi:hypothetical protein